ncbi:molybdenum cofactor guanylyltransferase [Methylophilaceae bacterium]|nr:molybdenum cofactor guanylyltransferase [Methylophilaceae bacterium]
MSISGIVLAGGLARRMGGMDKGLVEFCGKPMVAHVLERLKPQVDEILINANREIERYAAFGYPVIQDEIGSFAGPLAGLHRGMRAAGNSLVLTVPCDAPLLPADLASRLMHALVEMDANIAVAKTGTQVHPVFCLCRKNLRHHLESYLQNGGSRMGAWHDTLKVAEVAFDDNPEAFANINTVEELTFLENRHR